MVILEKINEIIVILKKIGACMLKKILKVLGIILLIPVVLFFVWYINLAVKYGQKPAEAFEINNQNIENKLLVAYQGSEYKNNLVDVIVKNLKDKSYYIKGIDVKQLKNIQVSDWKYIIIINSCERFQMNRAVVHFLKKLEDYNKIILHTTSGDSGWKTKKFDIDTISGASKNNNVQYITNEILKKIK
jgi:hypothetical protein